MLEMTKNLTESQRVGFLATALVLLLLGGFIFEVGLSLKVGPAYVIGGLMLLASIPAFVFGLRKGAKELDAEKETVARRAEMSRKDADSAQADARDQAGSSEKARTAAKEGAKPSPSKASRKGRKTGRKRS